MDESDDDTGEWGLALPFLTDSVEFANGVEVGMLWEQLKQVDTIDGPYHLANQDQILVMLSRAKWQVNEVKTLDEYWFHINAERGG